MPRLYVISDQSNDLKALHRVAFKFIFWLFYTVCHLYRRQGCHYFSRLPQYQAGSKIFQKKLDCCGFPRGRSSSGDNRGSGLTLSEDLITLGAKLDSEKWFLVLSVSVCWIQDGTRIAVMNSWHSKFITSVSGYCQLRVAVISVSLHRTICECLGT